MNTLELQDLVDGAGALVLDGEGLPLSPMVVVDLDGSNWDLAARAAATLRARRNRVVIGVTTTPLPPAADVLLEELACTLATGSSGIGPVAVAVPDLPSILAHIGTTVAQSPVAAIMLIQLLRATSRLGVDDGLLAESLAYSTLLAGEEFAAWRRSRPARTPVYSQDPVLVQRVEDELRITLNCPERHNAFGRDVRDRLVDALALATLDPAVTVHLRGAGPSFCSGGHLDEFGTAADVGLAHLVRVTRSPAQEIHRLADRVTVEVHGACIGAGIEVPSFAGRVIAHDDAWFRLPELGMGLIPGAGGTVGITQRIGRWRMAYLALTNQPVDVSTAHAWGLVDERA